MAIGGSQAAPQRSRLRTRVDRGFPRLLLGRAGWGAIGVTALFITLSCWWLSQDRAMPYGDAAYHLEVAFTFHDQLASGDWLGPFRFRMIYAPLTQFVGGLAIFIGGHTPAAPILAQNVVYVPLLAAACYCVGQRVFGARAGFLAVVFALGSPLIIEQFHVFMLDAPLAALVAATVWLALASKRFRRVDVSLAAGCAAGLGLLTKQSFPVYVFGVLLMIALRGGGWRNWRGIAAFGLAALAIAGPWYAYNASQLHGFLTAANATGTVPPLAKPPRWSAENFEWYFWALANSTLLVPLLAFALVGVGSAAVATVRRQRELSMLPELLVGALSSWLALTLMTHHDVRYTEPLIIYLAVLGTGWIALLRPRWQALAGGALGLAVVAATLGATFGVGDSANERAAYVLPGNWRAPRGEGVPQLHRLTLYTTHNFMVSGPRYGGDILGLLKDLRNDGIRRVVWFEDWAPLAYADFNNHGIQAFASIAEVKVPYGAIDLGRLQRDTAVLMPERRLGRARPCVELSGGVGLWIRLGNPWRRGARDYCPRFDPPVYGP